MNIYKYIVGLALCISFNAFAWDQKFQNNTDGEILVRVNYSAPGICSIKEDIIPAGGSISLSQGWLGGCCVSSIDLYSRSGRARGKVYTFEPPRAGINMTCAHVHVTIMLTADDNLTAAVSISS
ncbi:MAG TPA: hypothetical protein VGW78_03735 [Candidatus Babeliales bacterium]|nr:hypothetical protein [Candidatus Babeliales bacterium]